MFIVVEPLNAPRHLRLVEKMFRLRTRVFRDKLGWDVTVDADGLERDRFDDEGPVYLIMTGDGGGEVLGSLRLLPTTGPTLLSEFFHDTAPDAAELVAPTIWECTRFCIDSELTGSGRVEMIRTAGALLAELGELGLKSGIETVIGNFDPVMLRVYRRMGCRVDVLGSTSRYGRPVYLGAFPVDRDHLAAIRTRLGRLPLAPEHDARERLVA